MTREADEAERVPGGASALTALVLAGEEERRAEADARMVLPDDALPGIGASPMALREAIKFGGLTTIVMLTMLTVVEQFDLVAVQVLAPDIQKTLKISDTQLAGLASVGGVFLVLCTLPFAALADRFSRTRVLGGATGVWSLFVLATSLVSAPFFFALARAGAGLGASANVPVSAPVLLDRYPIQARSRILSLGSWGRPVGQIIGTFIAGGTAAIAGGTAGWRWAFVVIAVPAVLLAVGLNLLPDPRRGRVDQQSVLGAEVATPDDAPVRLSAAFQRLKKIRSFYFLVTGIGVYGFALVAIPLQVSKLLEDSFGYSAFTRGWMIALALTGSVVAIPIGGVIADRLFRKDPRKALALGGKLILTFGLLFTIALRFHAIAGFIGLYAVANAAQGAAFTTIAPTVASTVPFRMRGQAFSLIGIYIFLMGGFFGGLLAGAFSDRWGERTSLTIIVPPAALLGGLLLIHGARYLKGDISLAVAEMLEEQEERARVLANPDDVPVLQVRHLDVSYGTLQVLFDVNVEVRRGEVLALLGTNGAGKSTLLRAVGGLVLPDRGAVRLNGRTITFVEPERRAMMGMVQVPGGEALFTSMSVRENLQLWSQLVEDRDECNRRLEEIYATFPMISQRLDQRAGSLSGGQQQMLALAKAILVEPELLLIDELSLGLAPVVVQELLGVVERLKARGITMVIVEQSVNVALSVADRAVFMERGQVRFEGPAQDLLERDDLLRAVFLSGAGA